MVIFVPIGKWGILRRKNEEKKTKARVFSHKSISMQQSACGDTPTCQRIEHEARPSTSQSDNQSFVIRMLPDPRSTISLSTAGPKPPLLTLNLPAVLQV